MNESAVITPVHYRSPVAPTWCAGCGNFGIHAALMKALAAANLAPSDVLLCFDIGCNGNMSDKIGGYRIHGLHGRVLPLAAGAALSNRRLKVIALAGDGATYGEGVNHLIATFRSNYDFTFIVHNNGTYGLTTGQASPTTPTGTAMLGQPAGAPEAALDPLALAFAMQPGFIGRGHSAKFLELVPLLVAAIQHRGFSFVDIIQACPTYDRQKTFESSLAQLRDVATIPGYDAADFVRAREAALDPAKHGILQGILYQNPNQASYLDRVPHRAQSQSELVDEVAPQPISRFLPEFI